MINPMDLTGKLVLVTGASSGIGRDTSIHLSRLGARVILSARREENLAETLGMLEGEGHKYYPFDLTHIEEIEAFVKKIISDSGALDGFVHCAGVEVSRPLSFMKYKDVQDIMLVNFYAFVDLCRVISKKNNFNPGLSIVGISSIAAETCKPGQTAYSASKAAMNAAARCMAIELSSKNIRVNTIMPSMIDTEMWERYCEKYDRDADHYKKGGGMGVGQTLDVANMAAYLISDASKFITRSDIQVTGGYHGQVS